MLKSSEPITVPSCNYASPTSIILGSDLSPAASVPARVHNQNGTQAHASTTAEGESNERVADGETASSSFLLYLRETLRPYVGPIPFTEDKIQDLLLETGMPIEMHGLVEPEADQIYTLAEYYFEATSGILYLFTTDELETLMAQRLSLTHDILPSPEKQEDAAAVNIALAIGAQLHSSSDELKDLAASHFWHGREIAFKGMLGVQSLSMVRLFTLLAFYMIGACQRDTASMYLGVAAKAAAILGLHRSGTYQNLSKEESNLRLMMWNSLRNVDVLSSFIFGKPKSLPTVQQNSSRTHLAVDGSLLQTLPAFCAIAQGCSLLEEIVEKLSCGRILNVPTAEYLLEKLRSWSRSLPTGLRKINLTSDASASPSSAAIASTTNTRHRSYIFSHAPGRVPTTLSQQSLPPFHHRLVASIHVSCVNYFSVILITRPFLIAYLLSRLRGRAPDQLIPDPTEASDVSIKNSSISKLAQVCVSAAIYTSDTCHSVSANGYVFGNLCLLKAWVFGAGLVLGFSKFAGEPRWDIDMGFERVVAVLKDIARVSPQAKLYVKILDDFREAVETWRMKVTREVRRTVDRYMDCILDVEGGSRGPNASQPLAVESAGRGAEREASARHESGGDTAWNEWSDPFMGDPFIGDPVQSGPYSTANLGFGHQVGEADYDDMLFNFEPFEKLFYSVE